MLKWIIILLAVFNFGFMAFDGLRALTVGDYIRPQSGEYAGQLGPWSKIVSAIGIDPESTLMKGLFVVWGIAGLGMALCFGLGLPWAWKGLLIISIATLWYLVPGTVLSALVIVLLFIFARIHTA
ncbi:MAG: hypothetical protein R3B47_20120 [Bacteroidia bacterium]